MSMGSGLTRRGFLRRSLAWSAMASLAGRQGFATQAEMPRGAAHALIVGDWGWDGNGGHGDLRDGTAYAAQGQVAGGMRRYAAAHGLRPEALFLLGDNWYGDLVGGAQSERWQTQFEQMYPASAFPGPAYAMLGNHDYQYLPASVNKVEAELEYARVGRGVDGGRTRWTLPERWYSFDFPQRKPLIRCLVLDSNMPRPDGLARHGADFTLTPEQQAEQLLWLRAELAKPRVAPFLVVMAHHPVYSNGPHGDHPVLVRDWAPLFAEHKVDFYFAGHDHDLQVLQMDGAPTTHFLSGGGGADLYVLKRDDSQRGPYSQEVHGFSHLSVTAKELQLRHLDASGRLLFAVAKSPGGALRML